MKEKYLGFLEEVYSLCKKGEGFSMTQVCSTHGIDTNIGTILTKVGIVADTGYREKSRRIYEWIGESPSLRHISMINDYKVNKPVKELVCEVIDDGVPKKKKKKQSERNTYIRNDKYFGYFD